MASLLLVSNHDTMDNKFIKLTNIVYELLEFFPEAEPLKNKAKEKALAVLESNGKNTEDIDALLGYLKLAKMQGWLSGLNYIIISQEYEKLRQKPIDIGSRTKLAGEKLNERQIKILDYLKEKEKAQVMDLQQVLADVTKRTIRRDVDELLRAGSIVRMGEFNQVFYKLS